MTSFIEILRLRLRMTIRALRKTKKGGKMKKYLLTMVLAILFVAFTGIYTTADDGQVTPRIFTPNGDTKNDVVSFTFPNPDPGDTSQLGRIFDIQGHRVYDLDMSNTTNTEIKATWSGVGIDGNVVRSGIYIYQIETSTKVFNGTVVLAK